MTIPKQSKKSPQRIDTILESIGAGASTKSACESAGIDYTTFWGWCQDEPALQDRYDAVRDSRVVLVEDKAYMRLITGDAAPVEYIYYLNNRSKGRWLTKSQQEHTLPGDAGYREFYRKAAELEAQDRLEATPAITVDKKRIGKLKN